MNLDDLVHKMVKYYNELHHKGISEELTEMVLRQTIVKYQGDITSLEYFLDAFIEEADRILRAISNPIGDKDEM